MSEYVNLVKLSVGSQTVSDLIAWQNNPRAQGAEGCPRHVTRMWPKREKEIVNGGSIYWVIKGQIQCRQKIIRLDEIIGNDGIRRCAIVLDKNLISKKKSEQITASGTTALLQAARVPVFD